MEWEVVNTKPFVLLTIVDPYAMEIRRAPREYPAYSRVHGPVPRKMAAAWMEKNNASKVLGVGNWIIRRVKAEAPK